jgi:hypothetical protein
MLKKKIKISVVVLTAFACAFLLHSFSQKGGDFDFLETSFVGILQKVVEQGKPEAPDLSIERVSLKKTASPDRNFNYYRYNATLVVKNNGGRFRNSVAVLSGDNNQKHVFLKNGPDGFSLDAGETYIVDSYEVLFDGNYNGGQITLRLELKDVEHSLSGKNFYRIDLFEPPAKIDDITIKNISRDGEVFVEYKPSNLFLSTDNYEIYVNKNLDFDPKDLRYAEVFLYDRFYDYYSIKSSKELLSAEGWENVESVQLGDSPFRNNQTYFVYVKASNPETQYYGVSNILKVVPQRDMRRNDFAKLFVDYAGIEIYDDGEIMFKDVKLSDWHAPYVQTLFNLGLLDHNELYYSPNEKATRAEVLMAVMDYFDVDLSVNPTLKRFEDVSAGDFINYYTQALSESGASIVFGDYFHGDLPATRNYMKYLVDVYK